MSAGSPSKGARLRSLRPWFLVAAMILSWLIGVQGVTNGCGTVAYLREGSMPDEVAALEAAKAKADPVEGAVEFTGAANMRAIAEARRVMMPISVGRVLLSLLLVASSAMVLAGRRGARSFALQVLAANALFAVAAYALTMDMRQGWISAAVRGSGEIAEASGAAAAASGEPTMVPVFLQWLRTPAFWYWAARFKVVVLEVGVLGLAALAVSSKRTRAFLDAVARAEERLEREDEP